MWFQSIGGMVHMDSCYLELWLGSGKLRRDLWIGLGFAPQRWFKIDFLWIGFEVGLE